MPFWPFKRRRSGIHDVERQPLDEKSQALQGKAGSPDQTSKSAGRSKRRISAQQEKLLEAQSTATKKRQGSDNKENVSPAATRRRSIEDITALPGSKRLDSSPHLRPVDLERPAIPYNFRPYSASQTSIQRLSAEPARPRTLRSRNSGISGAPSRRFSGRRKDATLREEELRAMSQPVSIPKRRGEGPLRTDSKKFRGLGIRGSNVSLPPQESVHSSMSGVAEQRGWEVGVWAAFNPRPAVRLSGTPQYVAPSSLPGSSRVSPQVSKKDKEKQPMSRTSARKRQTVGAQADQFDAGDLRVLMERDAKRRERREKEQQEKLDRKLRERKGRNRGDSDKSRRSAKERKQQAEEVPPLPTEDARIRQLMTPPPDTHPALRGELIRNEGEIVGLGEAMEATSVYSRDQHQDTTPENPFEDPPPPFEDPRPAPLPPPQTAPLADLEPTRSIPGAFTPLESPMEDPIVSTAQAVRLSQTSTPPLSPIRTGPPERVSSRLSQVQTPDQIDAPSLPTASRRTSEARERRPGAWASFFRRGATTSRRPAEEEGRDSPSPLSFSNTSRESMRHQPLPAHLVGTQAQPAQLRKSGAPVRTQSKFREDLPEIPVSPPDSRIPSPDATQAAAIAAAIRRARQTPAMDVPGARFETPDPASINRNDTPISPDTHNNGLMSASLASVDSEASWLASAGKRQSMQSSISRGMGSISKRKPEFTGSYEELGGDRDAEYFKRVTPSPTMREGRRRKSSTALTGAGPDKESEDGEEEAAVAAAAVAPGAQPFTVHESMRRKPTLVHGDPRLKSREGLTEYAAATETAEVEVEAEAEAEEGGSPKSEYEHEESEVRSAKSVNYGRHHARHLSAGSAKLLDISSSKRASADLSTMSQRSSMVGPAPASRTSQL
ncbi:hypothetical protein BAUCODRAFT_78725 [Baudoinia panamericana UAMH 10762]|uniref:Uncharacterized protein n=1 Tax=Baudoinia panamericana (strain UAMH 10762) TaxID=717646 RepID=M2MYY9_BAUPA|nr:uncharacterized protein BAUCODRAFT_78725 [Baudoinia panamericana UAMH 10762]EMC91904.1 hypothetical protein BAUCODRAFT_78725 [Baudoinia panamericana UAMH 10762]